MFVTFEGIDGSGKSTQVDLLRDWLVGEGHEVVVTREPGGTELGEGIRQLVLNGPEMTPWAEAALFASARAELAERVIRPALQRGHYVLCDRFSDATYAYQGGGHGVSREWIRALAEVVHPDCNPDATLLFDLPPEVSRERLARSRSEGRTLDKFEQEADSFFERVRAAYLERAAAEPGRFRIVDSTRPIDEVRGALASIVAAL